VFCTYDYYYYYYYRRFCFRLYGKRYLYVTRDDDVPSGDANCLNETRLSLTFRRPSRTSLQYSCVMYAIRTTYTRRLLNNRRSTVLFSLLLSLLFALREYARSRYDIYAEKNGHNDGIIYFSSGEGFFRRYHRPLMFIVERHFCISVHNNGSKMCPAEMFEKIRSRPTTFYKTISIFVLEIIYLEYSSNVTNHNCLTMELFTARRRIRVIDLTTFRRYCCKINAVTPSGYCNNI